MGEALPFLTPKQIRTALDDLVESGAVIKANLNANPHDRTLWYSVTVEIPPLCPAGQRPLTSEETPVAPAGKCVISGIEPNDQTNPPADPAGEKFVDWFLDLLKRTKAPEVRLTVTNRAAWADAFDKLQRIDGKSKAQIWKACEWARNDPFWSGNFYAPTKLRERKDGVARIDLFLDRMANPQNESHRKSNGRGFEQTHDLTAITDK